MRGQYIVDKKQSNNSNSISICRTAILFWLPIIGDFAEFKDKLIILNIQNQKLFTI